MREHTLSSPLVRSLLVPREKNSHKGVYGHVLVVAGSRDMGGAPALCTAGALRAGAGLVTLCVPESLRDSIVPRVRTEAMTLSLPDRKTGFFGFSAFPAIMAAVKERKITSLVIGPGLGRHPDTAHLVKKLLASLDVPAVLDADGLSAYAGEAERGTLRLRSLSKARAGVIVTPHAGEMSRLTGLPVPGLQKTRVETAVRFAAQNGVVCLLKGYRTVVTDGETTFINPAGNPGMATGGSGDVLAGIIGALIAQVKAPHLLNAAAEGAYLHGLAGDLAAKEKTEICLLAGDIADYLPKAIKKTGTSS